MLHRLERIPAPTLPRTDRDAFGNVTRYSGEVLAAAREAVRAWLAWETPADLRDRLAAAAGLDLAGDVVALDLEPLPASYVDALAPSGDGVLLGVEMLIDTGPELVRVWLAYVWTSGLVDTRSARAEYYRRTP